MNFGISKIYNEDYMPLLSGVLSSEPIQNTCKPHKANVGNVFYQGSGVINKRHFYIPCVPAKTSHP